MNEVAQVRCPDCRKRLFDLEHTATTWDNVGQTLTMGGVRRGVRCQSSGKRVHQEERNPR
jgi:hypothetical protein